MVAQGKKTRITVDIYNKSYTIVGDESASHVRLVASLVDQKMKEISKNNPNLDRSNLAVLTAVNTMNEYLKLKEDYAILIGSIKRERGLKDARCYYINFVRIWTVDRFKKGAYFTNISSHRFNHWFYCSHIVL